MKVYTGKTLEDAVKAPTSASAATAIALTRVRG